MRKLVYILAALVAFLYACVGTFEDLDQLEVNLSPTFAFPIANSTFNLEDFVNKGDTVGGVSFESDANGLYILTYENTDLFSQQASSFIQLPDETASESFRFDPPVAILLPFDLTVSQSEQFSFNIDSGEGDELDSVLVRSGNLNIKLLADFPASGEVKFTFNSLFENGAPLVVQFDWTYTGQTPSLNVDEIIDLSSLKLDLTEGGTTFNSFSYEVAVTLFYEGFTVLSSQELSIEVELLGATFDSIHGKIAERTIAIDPDTLSLDFFESFESGTFQLDEPSIEITIGNSYGLPVGFDLDLEASNATSTIALTGDITSQQLIAAPTLAQLGDTIETILAVGPSNSNFPDIINLLPTQLIYQVNGVINPGFLEQKSFVLYESSVNVGLKVKLPLKGRVSGLTASEEFDFDGTEISDNLESALFQIYTNNGFPLDVDLQVFFLDAARNEITSLIDNTDQLIVAAEVDSDGIVTNPAEQTVEIILDETKADLISNARYIRVDVGFSTLNDGNTTVQILDSYNIQVRIGAQLALDISEGN